MNIANKLTAKDEHAEIVITVSVRTNRPGTLRLTDYESRRRANYIFDSIHDAARKHFHVSEIKVGK